MNEDEILSFIRAEIGSVYTLEVLLLLKQDPARVWSPDELVRELRSSRTAVADALRRILRAGFAVEGDGTYSFGPASPQRGQLAAEIDNLYRSKPITVVKAIMAEPEEKLRAFSDAFRLKD